MLLAIALCTLWSCAWAHNLPSSVQLGSAIVAAVEQDVEQEETQTEQRMQRAWLKQAEQQIWQFLSGELSDKQLNQALSNWADEARGKHHKHKKLMRMLMPLLAAALLAKAFILPLVLKALTALSASSFVMGKIALVTSGLLALKSIMSRGNGHDRLEIVHAVAPSKKTHHGYVNEYSDLSGSGSSWWPLKQNYIPVAAAKDAALYRYPQHNYDATQLDKPFL